MIKVLGSLLTVFSFLLCCNVVAQTNDDTARSVDSLFSSYNANTPGAVVAILRDGNIIFSKGYGKADMEHDIPVTPKTIFNIASLSKQFTAFAIYLLQSEGKISFEDDVRRYIKELPDYGTPVRIKHLLAHTSGLRDQAALLSLAGRRSGDAVTTEEILKLAALQKGLNFTPGTAFNYNNTGYTLLAEIVARVTGKTFAQYTNEKIFLPLRMTSTHFEDNYETIVKNRAQSYEKNSGVYHRKPINTSNVGPSNLLTTTEDLAKWVLNFEKPIVGSMKMINAFNEASYLDNGQKVVLRVFSPGDTAFHAKGQNLSIYKGLRMWTHGGHTAAFRTFMGRFPDQRFAIITLSNDEHNERLNARWQIADLYLKDAMKEDPETVSSPVSATPKPVANYTANLNNFEGEYYSDELRTSYHFVVRNDQLIMTHLRLSDIKLNRTGENSFSGSGAEMFAFQMDFLRDASGNVHAFTITNFGIRNMRFVKVK